MNERVHGINQHSMNERVHAMNKHSMNERVHVMNEQVHSIDERTFATDERVQFFVSPFNCKSSSKYPKYIVIPGGSKKTGFCTRISLSLLPVAQSLASAEGRSRVNTGGDSMAITARDLYAQQVAIDGHFPFPRSAAPPLCQGGHSSSSSSAAKPTISGGVPQNKY
ncbi:hypothetical protein CEXT_738401 [Caerostris extrusa]|uniref:Uncharacterized protein n=1 Tax=Caerostris extrusa TaxID=172846 RepID=A0AAV4VR09_CAEEX|nr:hypothetical protein CEXT_738401 [Caerostris extrusa]